MSRDAVMEMERIGIPIRSSAASGVGSALMDDIATTYFFDITRIEKQSGAHHGTVRM
jgi:hypothetical protein